MKSELRERAVNLRIRERKSYSAIQKILKVSRSTLSYWLRDLPLSESEIKELRKVSWKKGEAGRERFRNSMRQKKMERTQIVYESQKKMILPMTRRDLFIAGVILYVGEGDKRNPNRIALANSDPIVLRVFLKWLADCLIIPKEDVRLGLHLYSNMNIAKEVKFWQDTLGFGRNSFYKTQIRPVRTRFSYADGDRHGTCTVYVIGSGPKARLMQMIKVVLDEIMRV
jgi:hypothetical protein